MNNVNANTNTDKEEIKYLTLDDIDKMYEEAEPRDWGFVDSVASNRYRNLITDTKLTKIKIERLPADHSKFLLDFYNLFDENEPYKDKEGRPYRDNLLNDLYFNIYNDGYVTLFSSSNGKRIDKRNILKAEYDDMDHVFAIYKVGTREIPVLDENQKIEKLKNPLIYSKD